MSGEEGCCLDAHVAVSGFICKNELRKFRLTDALRLPFQLAAEKK